MSAEETTTTPQAESSTAPPRVLPDADDIAAFIRGQDVPQIAYLFDQLKLARFDALVMQIQKQELLPQHWQIMQNAQVDASRFDSLPEVGRLRTLYRDQELSRARLKQLKTAWIHLRGKQPSLWTVADLFAALRRIIDRGEDVDFHNLLAVVRDVWAAMTLPAGRERLDELWAVLEFVRSKTKK